ncbi:VOC family protein [Catellatospora coxensis]
MTIQRMDNVGIVVDDLDAAVAFFTELGMELEGRSLIEGSWAEKVVGLGDMRSEVAMMRVPDGPGRLELVTYHSPKMVTPTPAVTPPNTLGLHRVMFAVDDLEDTLARLRRTAPNPSARCPASRTATCCATCAGRAGSSSRWPSS